MLILQSVFQKDHFQGSKPLIRSNKKTDHKHVVLRSACWPHYDPASFGRDCDSTPSIKRRKRFSPRKLKKCTKPSHTLKLA
ncbi:hypothetical protein OAL00_03965, partial [Verrucomicrobiales bacterium]|nr:hypothetical protein [Verrucomicrobiales bacterium]